MIETADDIARFVEEQRREAEDFMAKSESEAAAFARDITIRVENWSISESITAYMAARTGVKVAAEMTGGNELAVRGANDNVNVVASEIIFKLSRTDRFKNIKYIAFDDTHILTENGIFLKSAYPDASQENTLSFEQMLEIKKNSQI